MRSGLLVLATVAALGACSGPRQSADSNLLEETAERHRLLAKMAQHPSLNDPTGAATGKPINVPTTIKPRPAGVSLAAHHHASAATAAPRPATHRH